MEALSGNIENKIKNAITDLLWKAPVYLVRPAATLTEVFFRKSFGERYFSYWNIMAGTAIIAAGSLPFWTKDENLVNINYIVGAVWMLCLVVLFRLHQVEVIKRYKNNLRWHSYNSGIPRIAKLPYIIEKILPLILSGVLFYFGLWGLGVLLVVSTIASVWLQAHAKQLFYNRLLDTIDGQIEQENLQKAMLDQRPPQETEGYRAYPNKNMPKKSMEKFVKTVNKKL